MFLVQLPLISLINSSVSYARQDQRRCARSRVSRHVELGSGFAGISLSVRCSLTRFFGWQQSLPLSSCKPRFNKRLTARPSKWGWSRYNAKGPFGDGGVYWNRERKSCLADLARSRQFETPFTPAM